MKIYSIKELVKSTNNIYNSKSENINLIVEEEKSIPQQLKKIQNVEQALVLKNEISTTSDNELNPLNHKVKIKPEVKDHMINELYLYLKKKIKKNTLKLIIDEQLEIKNLKNEVIFLKKIEHELTNNYEILKNKYKSTLEINKELKINGEILQNDLTEVTKNLTKVTKNKDILNTENKELKNNQETFLKVNKELKNNNKKLQNGLKEVTNSKENLDKKNKELKVKLKETRKKLKDSIEKNRSFEISTAEIKSTLSKYVVNYKKLQEKINLVKDSKNLKLEKELQKIKFYQAENTRLSSELLSMQKKNQIFKENFKNIEIEKEKISSKIKDLNKSIEEKTNVISSPVIKSSTDDAKKDIEELNDKEQKSLDEAINRIFAKI